MTQFPEVSASRQDIRQLIRQRRRALTPDQQAHFAQQAAARMMAYPPV
ncbi:5-formyltetrahydrofolate cyclo-ligase, partial [Escherichia coli]|nr:5-formyltetrahydrofolate cyclo-ligase [Escherichia coli]